MIWTGTWKWNYSCSTRSSYRFLFCILARNSFISCIIHDLIIRKHYGATYLNSTHFVFIFIFVFFGVTIS